MYQTQDDTILNDVMELLNVNYHPYSGYLMVCCLFHDDYRPSMAVYPDWFYCKSCGKSGKTEWLLNYLRQKHGVFSFSPRAQQEKFYNPWRSWQKQYGSLGDIINKAHDYLVRNNKTVYLTKRKITLETIKQLKLGYLQDYILIPFFDRQNVLVGATCRYVNAKKYDPKYINPSKQDPQLLYVPSWRLLDEQRKTYVLAGLFDSITLFQLGISSLSTTTGQDVSPQAFSTIPGRKIFCFDRGEERKASYLAHSTGIMSSLLIAKWPEGIKDINQLFIEHDADAVYALLGENKELVVSR